MVAFTVNDDFFADLFFSQPFAHIDAKMEGLAAPPTHAPVHLDSPENCASLTLTNAPKQIISNIT